MNKKTIAVVIATCFAALTVGCSSGSSKMTITAEKNPTTLAGRGAPDLSDHQRPAAWIYIDGEEGHFTERDGIPQVEWIIDGPVSSTPTFRVEVYEPLLGTPKDFNCVFYALEPDGGSGRGYGIAAEPGTFRVGRDYSLTNPGPDFVIRVPNSDILVEELEPLEPGNYMVTAGVKNSGTGVRALAVTYFTVGGAE